MKVFLRRMTAVLLCAVMLLSVVPFSVATVTAATQAQTNAAAGITPVLAYVPLDDRPVVVDRVIYSARAAGFDIQLPPDKAWYQTHLDNQLKNPDNPNTKYTDESQVGNGAKIMEWLESMEANGCDYYVIHLDMMFSGGLVGSRYPDTHYDSNNYLNISEQLVIAEKLKTLAAKAENHVYFVDTLMRLASTGGFKGYESAMYSALRVYAGQARQLLDPGNWKNLDYAGAESVLNEFLSTWYQRNPETWKPYPPSGVLTQTDIDLYCLARHRKMRLIHYMMEYARNAYYIIGVDDASPKNTIQTNEINFIETRMKALGIDYSLFADTDSAGLMAVARCAADYYGYSDDNKITVRVRYYGGMADQPADDYDIGTLRTNVETHVDCANGEVTYTSGVTGDVQLLVLTKIASDYTIKDNGQSSTYEANIDSLINQAKYNIENNIPTIIVDCSTERNYQFSGYKKWKNLQDEMLTKLDVSRLLGYSNWNTVGNTLGIGIGMGMARYAYLENAQTVMDSSNIAFVQSMTYALIKDITYNARQKHSESTTTFQYWVRYKAGGSGWTDGNFFQQMLAHKDDSTFYNDWELCRGERYVNNNLEWEMMKGKDANAYNGCGQQVLNAIMNGKMYTSLKGSTVKTAAPGTVTLSRFRFPWYRQFEITFDISVTPSNPYKQDGSYVTAVSQKQSVNSIKLCVANLIGADANDLTVKKNGATMAQGFVGTGYTVSTSGNSYAVVVTGDIVTSQPSSDLYGNGAVDTTDVRSIMQHILDQRTATYTAAQTKAADHDGNGKISSTDARRVLQDALGK